MLIIVALIGELVKMGHKLNAKYWFDWKKWNTIKRKNLLSNIKMGKEILTIGDIEIEKHILFF